MTESTTARSEANIAAPLLRVIPRAGKILRTVSGILAGRRISPAQVKSKDF